MPEAKKLAIGYWLFRNLTILRSNVILQLLVFLSKVHVLLSSESGGDRFLGFFCALIEN